MKQLISLVGVATALLIPQVALAKDAVTIVFKSGLVVRIDDGYKQVVEATRASSGQESLTLNLDGNPFVLKVSEVAVVCKDDCAGMIIKSGAPRVR